MGSEVGSKTNRPCTSEVRSRVGEASLVTGSPGRLQSRLAGSERETEALRAAVVVGSLACFWVGEGPFLLCSACGLFHPGAHVRGAASSPTELATPPCPFSYPSAFCNHAGMRKTRCMVATAMITMDIVCGWSFLEAAVVQAEAAAGVEVAGLPGAVMAPLPGVLKTEWLSLVSLPFHAG